MYSALSKSVIEYTLKLSTIHLSASLLVTGHSLGAAEAVLAAVDL
jgi:putative lipase involved disintegration of autophagic bodies